MSSLLIVVVVLSSVGVLLLARRGAGHGLRRHTAVRTMAGPPLPDRDLRRAVCDSTLLLTGASTVQLWELDDRGRLLATATAGDPPTQRSVRLGDEPVDAAVGRVSQAMGKRLTTVEPVMAGDRTIGLLAAGIDDRAVTPSVTMRLLAAQIGGQVERRQLAAEATTDALTGLPNRRGFDAAVQRELSRAQRQGTPLAFAVVDLDHFKTINDTLGHAAGDLALRAVTAAWVAALRDTDLLSRTGGDEFAVLLPSCPPDEAAAVLDRVRIDTPMGLTCSIGLASHEPGETAVDLMARADRALYAAKRAGRNRVAAFDDDTEPRFSRSTTDLNTGVPT